MAAYRAFCKRRWAEIDSEALCPRCGRVETYKICTRHKFKCRACHHQFSVTAGMVFASRKMAFVDPLAALCLTVNGAKGMPMVQPSRDLDCQYKAAFVLGHKLREAMAIEVQTGQVLDGHDEVDRAYFGGHIRQENRKEDSVDRRLAQYQTGKRRVVVAFCEPGGRVLPFATKSEADGVELTKVNVDRLATASADEASHQASHPQHPPEAAANTLPSS